MTHPVMLVPRMAPRITEIAWRTFIMPAFTKPTTMTEVALEDWITAVTPVPSSIPRSGVPESRKRIGSSLFPETRFRPSPIRVIPKRKRETPVSRVIKSLIVKTDTSFHILQYRGSALNSLTEMG